MQQYWLLERNTGAVRYLYFCNAARRETAKRMASSFLLGDPDEYIVTPVSERGDIVKLRINIQSTSGVPESQ